MQTRKKNQHTSISHSTHTHTLTTERKCKFLMRNNVCNSLDGEKEHSTFLLFRLQAQNVCKTTSPGDRLSQSENGRRREKNSGEMCATGLKKKLQQQKGNGKESSTVPIGCTTFSFFLVLRWEWVGLKSWWQHYFHFKSRVTGHEKKRNKKQKKKNY